MSATMAPPSPSKPPPAPPPPSARPSPNGKNVGAAVKELQISSGISRRPQRVVVYGGMGIGKTSLAALLKKVGIRPLFMDLEERSEFLDVDRVSPRTWDELRAMLHSPACNDYGAIVIDSLTKAEELAVKWVLENVPTESGSFAKGIEGFGWGKGFTHAYETFLQLLGDVDAHIRAGRHVICIAHSCVVEVTNTNGDNWNACQPRLQSPASGKNSIRHRVAEWCDHLLYIGYDIHAKDGKASGSGTRTIYVNEWPSWWAKSTLTQPIFYEKDSPAIWQEMFGVNQTA